MIFGVLYICTGDYSILWDDFYKSAEKYLLPAKKFPNYQKKYFVFSDKKIIGENVQWIKTEHEPWPYPTMNRYKYFNQVPELHNTDYLYFFNANTLIVNEIDEDILPGDKDFAFAYMSWLLNRHPGQHRYEKNPKSLAFFDYKKRIPEYFAGGLNGGKTEEYLKMSKELEKNIDIDVQNGIIPRWHDESHMNKFAVYNLDRIKKLSTDYLVPEQQIDDNSKIIIRNKDEMGISRT